MAENYIPIRERLSSTTVPLPGKTLTIDMIRAKAIDLQTERAMSDGQIAAIRVASWIREHFDHHYPDAVNARCTDLGGEEPEVGILAVTWMRGREVFHRRYPVDSRYVAMVGAKVVADVLLLTITKHIQSTDGAERP